MWYLEPGTANYRMPQNRIVFGPLPGLPSTLLFDGSFYLSGSASTLGSQFALYFHQDCNDYTGGIGR